MIRIILDEHDAAQLLQVLYHGRRPKRVHTLLCVCGAQADLRVNPKAWNGWQVLPHQACPRCLERPAQPAELYPTQAREHFLEQVRSLTREGVSHETLFDKTNCEREAFAA